MSAISYLQQTIFHDQFHFPGFPVRHTFRSHKNLLYQYVCSQFQLHSLQLLHLLVLQTYNSLIPALVLSYHSSSLCTPFCSSFIYSSRLNWLNCIALLFIESIFMLFDIFCTCFVHFRVHFSF